MHNVHMTPYSIFSIFYPTTPLSWFNLSLNKIYFYFFMYKLSFSLNFVG
jgi:hypothetical protein